MPSLSGMVSGTLRGTWWEVLQEFLGVSHNDDGTISDEALEGTTLAIAVDDHIANVSNPHSVTKTQVGLGNADNTTDANKPVSTATQTALDLKADETDLDALSDTVTTQGTTLSSTVSTVATHTTQIAYTNPGVAPVVDNVALTYVNGDIAWHRLPTVDVHHYPGVDPTGVEDSTAGVLLALQAVKDAGGGTLRFSAYGIYLCNDAVMLLPSGKNIIIPIDFDNCRIKIDAGATLKSTFGHANGCALLAPSGSFKGAAGDYDDWADHWIGKINLAAYPVYNISAVAKGAHSITCVTSAEADNFVAGDLIYIRTGQTVSGGSVTEPDAELNEVLSVSAPTINLKYPTSKPFAQEYHDADGSGSTLTTNTGGSVTSSSVANPSVITMGSAHGLATGDTVTIAGHSGSTPSIDGPHVVTVLSSTTYSIPVNVTVGGTGGTSAKHAKLGVQKVTGAVIRNFAIEGPGKIDYKPSSNSGEVIGWHQIWGYSIKDLELDLGSAHFQNQGVFRWCRIENVRGLMNSSASSRVWVTGSTGVNDLDVIDCDFTSNNAMGFIHLAEGTAGFRVFNLKMHQKTVVDSNALITGGSSRGYDHEFHDVVLVRPSGATMGYFGSSGTCQNGLILDNVQHFGSSHSITAIGTEIRGGVEPPTPGYFDTLGAIQSYVFPIERWVYWNSATTLSFKSLPTRYVVHDAYVLVGTAFDGSGPTASMTLGIPSNSTRFLSTIDLSTTGKKGSITGVNNLLGGATTRDVEIYFTAAGGSPSAGVALVVMMVSIGPAGTGF